MSNKEEQCACDLQAFKSLSLFIFCIKAQYFIYRVSQQVAYLCKYIALEWKTIFIGVINIRNKSRFFYFIKTWWHPKEEAVTHIFFTQQGAAPHVSEIITPTRVNKCINQGNKWCKFLEGNYARRSCFKTGQSPVNFK